MQGGNFLGAILKGANLECAHLEGAYLLGANIEGASLEGADLEGAVLEGACLKDANLEGANLEGANLEAACLDGSFLSEASLRGADFAEAHMKGTVLISADLQNADLQGAILKGSRLYAADLKGANLAEADLRGTDLRDTDLRSAILRNARVNAGTVILGEDLKIDRNTDFTEVSLESAHVALSLKGSLKDNIRRIGWENWYRTGPSQGVPERQHRLPSLPRGFYAMDELVFPQSAALFILRTDCGLGSLLQEINGGSVPPLIIPDLGMTESVICFIAQASGQLADSFRISRCFG